MVLARTWFCPLAVSLRSGACAKKPQRREERKDSALACLLCALRVSAVKWAFVHLHGSGSAPFHVVGNLLEHHAFAPQPLLAQAGALPVNHLGSVMAGQTPQHLARQHIAAAGPLVAQDAVVERSEEHTSELQSLR